MKTFKEVAEEMSRGLELSKALDPVHYATQIKHLIKHHNRSTKRLMHDTKLPEKCIRRFKQINRKHNIEA